MAYPCHIYIDFWTNISICHICRISKSQIFWNVICMGYSMDILFQSARGPCSLGSLAVPSGPVATALITPSFATVLRRSSVSATDRPPRRCLPSLNCHSHWLISYMLLPFPPDSSAAAASPCGNLVLRCWRSWCKRIN